MSPPNATGLRAANLMAIEVMREYAREGEGAGLEEAEGLGGWVASWFSKELPSTTVRRRADELRSFLDDVEGRIRSGKAETIDQAIGQIGRGSSRYSYVFSDPSLLGGGGAVDTNIFQPLIKYTSAINPNRQAEEDLVLHADSMERYGAESTPLAVYALVGNLTQTKDVGAEMDHRLEVAQGHGTLTDYALKKIHSLHVEGTALEVGMMVASGGLGNLARLRTLARLEEAGVTGYKAVALGRAAGIGAEATAFSTGGTAREVWQNNAANVLDPTHLAKSYAANLLMVGGLKAAGELGELGGLKVAKSLNLVRAGGQNLTTAGKIVSGGISQTASLGGTFATNQTSQAIGLAPAAQGGWRESLAGDVVTTAQFAAAHRVADRMTGKRLSEMNRRLEGEVRGREARARAERLAEKLGYAKPEGDPHATENLEYAKAREALVTVLRQAMTDPAFSGDKFLALLKEGKNEEANVYLYRARLPLRVDSNGELYVLEAFDTPDTVKLDGSNQNAGDKPQPHELPPVILDPVHQSELDRNALLDYYAAPEKKSSLETLSADPGPVGEAARHFKEGLNEFEEGTRKFYKLEDAYARTKDAAIKREMEILRESLDRQAWALRESPYNRLEIERDGRLARAEADLRPLEGLLSIMQVGATAEANRTGGTPAISYQVTAKPLEAMVVDAGSVPSVSGPEDLLSVDVSVADEATAKDVAARLKVEPGLQVLSNHDLVSIDGRLTSKDLFVQSGAAKLPVTIRVRPPVETPEQQRAAIRRLQSEKGWNWQQVQDLIGVEKMKTLFGYGVEIPFGFENAAQFQAFRQKLVTELLAAGVPVFDPRIEIVLRGSAVRGNSWAKKGGGAYRWEPRNGEKASDVDVSVVFKDKDLYNQFLSSHFGQTGPETRRAARKVERERNYFLGKGRISDFLLDEQIQEAQRRINQTVERSVSISFLSPDCPTLPLPDEVMQISAAAVGNSN